MKRTSLIICVLALAWFTNSAAQTSGKKVLIAHRGASAYAPEHTLAAYRLALAQKADYVEQDLQITKDGVLVCLHDETLERTTNVKDVFPQRFKEEAGKRHWYVADFTLAEIKQLDAGAWFGGGKPNEKFKGERVPTFQEAIDLVRGKAGLYPETKAPESYAGRGFSMEKLLVEILKKNKLDKPNADRRTPIIIQSFSPASLRKLYDEHQVRLPLVLLLSNLGGEKSWLTDEGLRQAKQFAVGIGPAKVLIENDPTLVTRARALGLTVTPYTFRATGTTNYADLQAEMRKFLFTYNVDALFTDNPDQFPKQQ